MNISRFFLAVIMLLASTSKPVLNASSMSSFAMEQSHDGKTFSDFLCENKETAKLSLYNQTQSLFKDYYLKGVVSILITPEFSHETIKIGHIKTDHGSSALQTLKDILKKHGLPQRFEITYITNDDCEKKIIFRIKSERPPLPKRHIFTHSPHALAAPAKAVLPPTFVEGKASCYITPPASSTPPPARPKKFNGDSSYAHDKSYGTPIHHGTARVHGSEKATSVGAGHDDAESAPRTSSTASTIRGSVAYSEREQESWSGSEDSSDE